MFLHMYFPSPSFGLLVSTFQLFVIPWTVAHQTLLSMGFPRQEYWSGLAFPSPGDLPDQGSNLGLLHCRRILYSLSCQGSQVPQMLWERQLVNLPQSFFCVWFFFKVNMRLSFLQLCKVQFRRHNNFRFQDLSYLIQFILILWWLILLFTPTSAILKSHRSVHP